MPRCTEIVAKGARAPERASRGGTAQPRITSESAYAYIARPLTMRWEVVRLHAMAWVHASYVAICARRHWRLRPSLRS
jgi:hypothetical protein